MSEKLWGGRFAKTTDEMINEFQASIGFDRRMYREDIAGSIAHAAMLAHVGIISAADRASIEKGLRDILAQIDAGTFEFSTALEDIHMNIEKRLTDAIGATIRSRSIRICLCAARSSRYWITFGSCRKHLWNRRSVTVKSLCPAIRISSVRSRFSLRIISWRILECLHAILSDSKASMRERISCRSVRGRSRGRRCRSIVRLSRKS